MKEANNILFSIITPTYNRKDMIVLAVESVINQSYENWELIIVEDGSDDGTKEIIRAYNDPRIRFYHQENSGKGASRNIGILKSKGQYISFLDDDDYYLPDFLSTIYEKLKALDFPKTLLRCMQAEESDPGLKEIEKLDMKNADNPLRFIFDNNSGYFPFVTSREIFDVEQFNTQFIYGQDFHLLLRVAARLPLIIVPKLLCVYRNHPQRSVNREYDEDFNMSNQNRLAYLEDLIKNHRNKIEEFIPISLLHGELNKIAYFYSSTALKKGNFRYSLSVIRSMYWNTRDPGIFIYYKLSIYGRILYYVIRSLFRN